MGKNDRRTISRRSRVYSIDMAALANCCCEYNGAVTLTRTDFKDMRARRNVPGLDYVDTMFELRTVVGAGGINLEKFVNVKRVGCHV